MNNSTEASASIFGWQFQICASIYLMIKYFGRFEKMKLESKKEDIEITLSNNKKIYAQAKSKQKPLESNSDHSTKLRDALETLSNDNKTDSEKLIYVNNLESNPLNSTDSGFDKLSFLNYDDLTQDSKDKVELQLNNLGVTNFSKDKFAILKIPYYGNDIEQRQKYIYQQIANFLLNLECSENHARSLLDLWQTQFLHNATIPNNAVYIEKEDVIWTLIVLKLRAEDSALFCYKPEYCVDEEQFFKAIEKYEKFINYKEGHFSMVNELIYLYEKYKQSNNDCLIIDFINNNLSEIYNLVFNKVLAPDTDIIELTCSKIIARIIVMRRTMYNNIIRGACNYGD